MDHPKNKRENPNDTVTRSNTSVVRKEKQSSSVPYGSLDDSSILIQMNKRQRQQYMNDESNHNNNNNNENENENENDSSHNPHWSNTHDYHHQNHLHHHAHSQYGNDNASSTNHDHEYDESVMGQQKQVPCCWGRCTIKLPTLRQVAIMLSLYCNIGITISKLIAYVQTLSLSVLAALLDSVLDVVSQLVLYYTDPTSSDSYEQEHQKRSSALYPAGASRLEPIGVLTCAALMGMASFEVIKQSALSLFSLFTTTGNAVVINTVSSYSNSSTIANTTEPTATATHQHHDAPNIHSVYNMLIVLLIKIALLVLCQRGAHKRRVTVQPQQPTIEIIPNNNESGDVVDSQVLKVEVDDSDPQQQQKDEIIVDEYRRLLSTTDETYNTNRTIGTSNDADNNNDVFVSADSTLEALAQDHYNDCLSNGVAAVALLCTYINPNMLWFLDPIGAIIISIYIIYSWYRTGKEQIEHLTGKSAPTEFIQELIDIANEFDERIVVDTVRAYHFGPKFLVEIEIVMNASTLLFESHDLGMDLQYEIEGREEVERCFVHIDYQTRPYDEHVVSKVPELREKYIVKQPSVKGNLRSAQSI